MTSSIRNMRRILTSTCFVVLLSGCQIFPADTDAGQVGQIMRLAFADQPKVTLERAAAIPYATIGVQIGNGAQGILILATDNAGQKLWTSGSHISIVTVDGRITKTAGLPYNLGGTYPASSNETAHSPGITRLSDFPDLGLYGVGIICDEQQGGAETITLLGKPIDTMRSIELCHSDKSVLSWHFTNKFWRDSKSGFVWRTEQHIHPMQDMITIETLRPAE